MGVCVRGKFVTYVHKSRPLRGLSHLLTYLLHLLTYLLVYSLVSIVCVYNMYIYNIETERKRVSHRGLILVQYMCI